jgi:hypothetical protein
VWARYSALQRENASWSGPQIHLECQAFYAFDISHRIYHLVHFIGEADSAKGDPVVGCEYLDSPAMFDEMTKLGRHTSGEHMIRSRGYTSFVSGRHPFSVSVGRGLKGYTVSICISRASMAVSTQKWKDLRPHGTMLAVISG